jgi:transposase, IS30 family
MLTWDQGSEMQGHRAVTIAADIDIYFCDPHSPWQQPTNQNTNGLLRQHFPKGTDLNIHSPEDLDYVAWEMNDHPRKRLDFKKPNEIEELLLHRPLEPALALEHLATGERGGVVDHREDNRRELPR